MFIENLAIIPLHRSTDAKLDTDVISSYVEIFELRLHSLERRQTFSPREMQEDLLAFACKRNAHVLKDWTHTTDHKNKQSLPSRAHA
jgi:hypothetical protein